MSLAHFPSTPAFNTLQALVRFCLSTCTNHEKPQNHRAHSHKDSALFCSAARPFRVILVPGRKVSSSTGLQLPARQLPLITQCASDYQPVQTTKHSKTIGHILTRTAPFSAMQYGEAGGRINHVNCIASPAVPLDQYTSKKRGLHKSHYLLLRLLRLHSSKFYNCGCCIASSNFLGAPWHFLLSLIA